MSSCICGYSGNTTLIRFGGQMLCARCWQGLVSRDGAPMRRCIANSQTTKDVMASLEAFCRKYRHIAQQRRMRNAETTKGAMSLASVPMPRVPMKVMVSRALGLRAKVGAKV